MVVYKELLKSALSKQEDYDQMYMQDRFGLFGISTFVGYLTPNLFLCK